MTETTTVDTAAASATLASMLSQGQTVHALIVTAQLGLADLLAEGPRHAEELAVATGTHPRALYRLMRALAGIGVLVEQDNDCFALTPLAEPLRTGVPGSLRARAQYLAVGMQALNGLLYSVQTGESGWEQVFGVGHYEYFARHPETNTHFNAVMTTNTMRALPDILSAYDLTGIDTLVDVGGGRGLLLGGILQQYPRMQGVLLDLPHVVAEAPSVLKEAGVADRCRIVGGDFLTELPPDADAYILKNMLLGMSDAEAAQVFRACHAAMDGNSRLLIVGDIIGSGASVRPAVQKDLSMLVNFGEAGVRTEEELRALLTGCGFQLTRLVLAGRAGAIVEASRR